MKRLINYRDETVFLSPATLLHIEEAHPEISLLLIAQTLKEPDEVRTSSHRSDSELYYLARVKDRYICVVVKNCAEGNFIATALTASKPKAGKIIYQKKRA